MYLYCFKTRFTRFVVAKRFCKGTNEWTTSNIMALSVLVHITEHVYDIPRISLHYKDSQNGNTADYQ